MGVVAWLRGWWPLLVVLLVPLLLLPLPVIITTSEARAAYVVFLMAIYWVTEVIPIGVTSLIPVFLFPVMDVLDAKAVAKAYMSELLMLFLGGLFVAVAIERWNLHRRIALRVLLVVGPEPRWLMLGLMVATWFLSMWISNTATTAMMIPITEAVLQQMKGSLHATQPPAADSEEGETPVDEGSTKRAQEGPDSKKAEAEAQVANGVAAHEDLEVEGGQEEEAEKYYRFMCKGMSLSICYAANSGGIATLTGTGPNLVLKENADKVYAAHGLTSPVNFASWMGFGLPLSVLILLLCWGWLQVAFLRCRGFTQCCSKASARRDQNKRVLAVIREEYTKLGPISFAEGAVLFWFVILVVLWITRDLGGAAGWGTVFKEGSVGDSTPAILVGVILFFFPSQLPFKQRQPRSQNYTVDNIKTEIVHDDGTRLKPLLQWSDAHAKVPWSLFLLLGGGFALSEGCKVSGLSAWVGLQLEVLSGVNSWGVLFIICYMTAAMTEVTSNTAISILLMPILSDLALRTGVHPLYYMLPAALACSFAFMLPVATPPNAIVFSYGHVRVVDMMLIGLALNIFAVPILVVATGTWGDAMFGLFSPPAQFFNSSAAVVA